MAKPDAEERYLGYIMRVKCHLPDKHSMGQVYYEYTITTEKENFEVYHKGMGMGSTGRDFDYIFSMLKRFIDEENKLDDPWEVEKNYYGFPDDDEA